MYMYIHIYIYIYVIYIHIYTYIYTYGDLPLRKIFELGVVKRHSILYVFISSNEYYKRNVSTGWRRPTGCRFFQDHFLQMSPIISGSFAENDLEL